MMKRLIYILPVILLLLSCDTAKEHKVSYLITNSVSGFDVNYRNEAGNLVMKTVETSSAQDKWKYEYIAEEGDIVFVSAIYKDITSAITIQILIDGKVYKQGSSSNDTIKYVTVSGTVPYE